MPQQQQPNRDQRKHEHYRMNLSSTAGQHVKANVRNESPEYALGDRERKGDEDYSQKRGQALLDFSEIDLVDALEHRRADENQNRRRRVSGNHTCKRCKKKARQETERREDGS